MITNYEHDAAFRYTILDLLNTLNFFEDDERNEKSGTTLRLLSLPKRPANVLAQTLQEKGVIQQYSADDDIIEKDPFIGDTDYCSVIKRFISVNKMTLLNIGQNAALIVINPVLTLPYFTGRGQSVYQDQIREMQTVNCLKWIVINVGYPNMFGEGTCQTLKDNYALLGNCSSAFSPITSNGQDCFVTSRASAACLNDINDSDSDCQPFSTWPSNYFFTALSTGLSLLVSLHFYHKIHWTDNLKKILLKGLLLTTTIGLAGLNIFLPYFAEKTNWISLDEGSIGCLQACVNLDPQPYGGVGYYLPGTDKLPPAVMGLGATGLIISLNTKTVEYLKEYFSEKSLVMRYKNDENYEKHVL